MIRGRVRPRGRYLELVFTGIPGRRDPKRLSTGCEVGQEHAAEQILAEALAELCGADVAAAATGDLTVREWGETWIGGRAAKVSSKDEASLLLHHVYPELGGVPLSQLTKARMVDWVKTLPRRRSDRTGKLLSPRTVHLVADVVKRCLGEAVDRDFLSVNPCVWRAKRDLPPKRDVSARAREEAALSADEVTRLLGEAAIPLLRRCLYAGLLLAGPRPGELLARRVRDLEDSWVPLPLLRAPTGWNTKAEAEGPTKTGAKKFLPVHPAWLTLLREWLAEGWARENGRAPQPADLLFCSGGRTKPIAGYNLNRWFQEDLARLGMPGGRSVYACRATFISLAELGGASREQIRLITHPSPTQAFDWYTRIRTVWPERCRTVLAIRLGPAADPIEEVTRTVPAAGAENGNARNVVALRAFQVMGAAGFEPATPAV